MKPLKTAQETRSPYDPQPSPTETSYSRLHPVLFSLARFYCYLPKPIRSGTAFLYFTIKKIVRSFSGPGAP